MTSEPGPGAEATDKARQLRQLVHDVKSPLTVICMGVQALKPLRLDAGEFHEVYDAILLGGVEELKAAVDRLIDAVCPPDQPAE